MEMLNEILSLIDPSRLPRTLGVIGVIVLCVYVLIRMTHEFLDSLSERLTEYRLWLKQVSVVIRFGLILAGFILAISSLFSFSGQAVYAVTGVLLLGVGYALRDLFTSVISGFILMIDRPFQVGDRIHIDGHYGEVTEIGLRAVRLVSLDDNLISIPNTKFINDSVSSANSGDLDQMCVFSFFIGCNEDFERARKIVYEATAASSYVFLGKPIVVVLREEPVPEGAERFAIHLQVKAFVFDGRYEIAFGTDLHERVKRAFRRYGIRTAGEIEWMPGETDATTA